MGRLWTHGFEAAVLIYALHTASLETKPYTSFKEIIRWIMKGQRGIILNLLSFGKYSRVVNPSDLPGKHHSAVFLHSLEGT